MGDAAHSFDAYFKRATSPIVVLSLLQEKEEMYGYEIASEMKARSNGRFTVTVLYPVLYRLEEQKYIIVSNQTTVDGRSRSYYKITDAGRAYLAQTLKDYQALKTVFEALTGLR